MKAAGIIGAGALTFGFAQSAEAGQRRNILNDPQSSLMPLAQHKAHIVFVPHTDPSKIRILSAHEAEVLIHPASTTKAVSLAVNLEAQERQYLSEDTLIKLTDTARRATFRGDNSSGLTRPLPFNDANTIYMMRSFNDVMESTAEHVAQLPAFEDIVRSNKAYKDSPGRAYGAIMNDFSARHGMLQSSWNFSTGLAPRLTNRPKDSPNRTTAKDLMLATNYLLAKHPKQVKEYCAKPKYTMPDKTVINSTNHLLEGALILNHKTGRFTPRPQEDHLEGTFGLKTGYINESRHNIIVVAEQAIGDGEMATIGIVEIGCPSDAARTKDVQRHAEEGFAILRAERKQRLENPVDARSNSNYTEYATYEQPVYLDPELDSEPLIVSPVEYAHAVPRLALKR